MGTHKHITMFEHIVMGTQKQITMFEHIVMGTQKQITMFEHIVMGTQKEITMFDHIVMGTREQIMAGNVDILEQMQALISFRFSLKQLVNGMAFSVIVLRLQYYKHFGFFMPSA